MQFDAKNPFFTKFIVVPNRITGKKEGKMKVKWLQNRITAGRFCRLEARLFSFFKNDFCLYGLIFDRI